MGGVSQDLDFPPLLWGEAARADAFEHACMRAAAGCESGLVAYRLSPSDVQAALVFAPEVLLAKAMVMLPLCGVGLQNALGALAPPEVAVHLKWDGGIMVNGAACGRFRTMAASAVPNEVAQWLVIGFAMPLLPGNDRPGETPDQTALFAEGCADVDPPSLVEAWARHSLNWITRWEEDGVRPLHNEWRGLADGIGEPVKQGEFEGTFVGVDEDFGMLIRDEAGTHLVPLSSLLETAA